MTNKAKLNNILIDDLGWELKLMTDREATCFIQSLDRSFKVIMTDNATRSCGMCPSWQRLCGVYSWSIYITKAYDAEDLAIINAHQLSTKRKNITKREKELMADYIDLKEDPFGMVIELRGWSERVPTIAEASSPDYEPVRTRRGK